MSITCSTVVTTYGYMNGSSAGRAGQYGSHTVGINTRIDFFSDYCVRSKRYPFTPLVKTSNSAVAKILIHSDYLNNEIGD